MSAKCIAFATLDTMRLLFRFLLLGGITASRVARTKTESSRTWPWGELGENPNRWNAWQNASISPITNTTGHRALDWQPRGRSVYSSAEEEKMLKQIFGLSKSRSRWLSNF